LFSVTRKKKRGGEDGFPGGPSTYATPHRGERGQFQSRERTVVKGRFPGEEKIKIRGGDSFKDWKAIKRETQRRVFKFSAGRGHIQGTLLR